MASLTVKTTKKQELIDITDRVKKLVDKKSKICFVFCSHATAAITINENADPNICVDIINALNEIISEGRWLHDRIDKNGAAHIKAAIIGPSEMIPVKDSELILGRWQNIFLCEFDGPRERKIIVETV